MLRSSLFMILVLTSPLAAQVATDSSKPPVVNSTAVGLMLSGVMVPGEGGTLLGLVGVQVTTLRNGRSGAEVSVFTVPRALSEGFVILAPRAGAVWVTQHQGSLTYVKVGGWAAISPNEGGGVLGAYGGGGVIVPAGPEFGIRLEVEPHIALAAPTHPFLLFTVGFTSLPKR